MAPAMPVGVIALRNLAMLIFGALPVGVSALFANEAWLVEGGVRMSVGDLLLIYVTLLLPLAFGGYVHQLLIVHLARNYSPLRIRVVGALSSPVVLVVLPFMIHTRYLVANALPMLLGLAFYLVFLRYPTTPAASTEDSQA